MLTFHRSYRSRSGVLSELYQAQDMCLKVSTAIPSSYCNDARQTIPGIANLSSCHVRSTRPLHLPTLLPGSRDPICCVLSLASFITHARFPAMQRLHERSALQLRSPIGSSLYGRTSSNEQHCFYRLAQRLRHELTSKSCRSSFAQQLSRSSSPSRPAPGPSEPTTS